MEHLSESERNALTNVNVDALQAAFNFLPQIYGFGKTGNLYVDNNLIKYDTSGITLGLYFLHSGFRLFKQKVRTYNCSKELSRNPTPENAKNILLDFLSVKGFGIGAAKNSLKDVLLSTYLALCECEDPKNYDLWNRLELLEEHDKLSSETLTLRINAAIEILRGGVQESNHSYDAQGSNRYDVEELDPISNKF